MRLGQFFEKFELFADAPNAVGKMRELVLDLAVAGKVAEQDANDEPAAELLQRLIKFKLANPLMGRSGRSKEGPVELEADADGLPVNWVNTTIGEVLYVIRGASPRPKGDPQYFSGTRTPYHWVKISDIRKHGQNGLLMDTDEFLTEAGMRKSVLLPKGTLVLTNSATIGVPIVLGIEGCCIHDGYLAFPNFPHDLLSQKFLLYLFHTLKKHAERNARGLAQLNLNTDLVRSFPFGLPPLAEQKRIVAKVDELMALCDRLEAQQQERDTRHAELARASLTRFAEAPTPANLDFLFHKSYPITPADLRKAILILAVQGNLVPQDPNDEESSEILAAIDRDAAKALRTKRMRKPKPIAPYENDLPFELPYGWEWSQLGRLTAAEDNAMCDGPFGSKLKTEHYVESRGYAVIRLGNIGVGKFIWGKEGNISRQHFESLSSNHIVPGDLIVAGLADPLVRCCEVPPELGPAVNKADCFRVRLSQHMDRTYIRHFLNSPIAKAFAAEENHGMTRERINLGNAKALPVPVPPLAEQRRIVAKVDQLMALVDQLEAQLATSRAAAEKLMQAVVAELTGQQLEIAA